MKTKEELPACPVATAVSLIGGKWKLLILRNLKTRPWRFNELQRDLEGISQKVLTDSLRQMIDDGLAYRRDYREVPPRVEYALTPRGESLMPRIECEMRDTRHYTDVPMVDAAATVDENGLVTGLAKGKCTITAKSENGKTAKCTVTVNEYLPKRILIQKRYWTMNPGDEGQLECTFSPANTSDKTLIYSSSAPEIVSVDENGAFICHASGDAVLTATSTRASGVKEIAKIHVVGENTKPLSGLVIGVNAGHQKTPNYTQYPIEPGSSKTSAANKSGTRGKFSRTEEYVITLQISLKLEKQG